MHDDLYEKIIAGVAPEQIHEEKPKKTKYDWGLLRHVHENPEFYGHEKKIKTIPGEYVEGNDTIHKINALLWGMK